jgi:ubiquinone/menaquinone biosynthesis C-methylase UbiE
MILVPLLVILLVLVAAILAVFLGWRVLSNRRSLPCPSWLSWMVDNRFSRARTQRTLRQLDLSPGMHVLDAGCGPGRLTIPIAQAVGPQGSVLALDIQPEMLSLAQAKASLAAVSNIKFVLGSLGASTLPPSVFDRATLVTVLGEIPDKVAAMSAIFSSLKPGGFLLVSEVMGDPHYQSTQKVRALAHQAGFHPGARYGNWLAFSLCLEKPHGA